MWTGTLFLALPGFALAFLNGMLVACDFAKRTLSGKPVRSSTSTAWACWRRKGWAVGQGKVRSFGAPRWPAAGATTAIAQPESKPL